MLSVRKARKIMTFHLAQPSLKKVNISKINIRKAKISYCHIVKRGNLRVTYIGNPSVLPVLNNYVITPCKCSRLHELKALHLFVYISISCPSCLKCLYNYTLPVGQE